MEEDAEEETYAHALVRVRGVGAGFPCPFLKRALGRGCVCC